MSAEAVSTHFRELIMVRRERRVSWAVVIKKGQEELVDMRQGLPVQLRAAADVYFVWPFGGSVLKCLLQRACNERALVRVVWIPRHDDVRPAGEWLADQGDDRFERLSPHDDGVAHGELFEALQVLGDMEKYLIILPDGTGTCADACYDHDRYFFVHVWDYATPSARCLLEGKTGEGYNGGMAHYEVEVKSLLGAPEHALELKRKMCELDPACSCVSTNKQLNHYFEGGEIGSLHEKTAHLFNDEQNAKFAKIVERGTSFSVRSRQKDDEVLLVVKASVDEGTSENTVSRMEFEEPVDISLAELDELVLSAGFQYQAKWSREREEYIYKNTNVCFDRNAGYGYLAEFEKIVEEESLLADARREIDALMRELGVEELPQDRLARMFDFYNRNWRDYYGTDKTFLIE